MSILIDDLLKAPLTKRILVREKDQLFFVAKPESTNTIQELLSRLKDCIKIIKGKAFAVHYKEDESITY